MSEPTPAMIRAYAMEQTFRQGGAYVPKHWDADLFSKPYHQIIEYIQNIFNETLDEVEYYHTIPFLVQDMPKERLFVQFRESPQYMRMLQNEGTNDAKNNISNPLKQTPMPKSKVSLHSTTDPRDITKVLRDIPRRELF